MTNLSDRVKLARAGAAVERCHVHPHSIRYSVGHHSLDMVTMITLAWQAEHGGQLPRAELLVAAAFHDIPERITGDVPMPTKRALAGALDALEERVLRKLGVADVYESLTQQEQDWLLWADKVECILWAREESEVRGNRSFSHWGIVSSWFNLDTMPGAWQQVLAMDLLSPLDEGEFLEH